MKLDQCDVSASAALSPPRPEDRPLAAGLLARPGGSHLPGLPRGDLGRAPSDETQRTR